MKKLLAALSAVVVLVFSPCHAAEPMASKIRTNTGGFNNNFNSTHDTVQKALDTIDNLSLSGSSYNDSQARAAISESITGASYNNSTGVFSLDAGYLLPTTTNQTQWQNGATAYSYGNHATQGYLTNATALTGDVTGTHNATVVGDDSHAHTSSTISGIDISVDTNLAVSDPITKTDDTIGFNASYQLNASNLATGTVSTDLYTAYGDLGAESKIGTGATQVSAGDHGHSNYSNYTSTNATVDTGMTAGAGVVYPTNISANIGIGLSDPVAPLMVKGDGNTTGHLLRLQSSTGVDRVTILDNRNVGIGTTNPAYPLDVVGDINNSGVLRIGGGYLWWDGAVGKNGFSSSSSTMTIMTNQANGLRVFTNYVNSSTPASFVVSNNSNVGIGTTTPAGKLSIVTAGTTGTHALIIGDSSGVNRLTVLDNGNVGIGTTAPEVLLSVLAIPSGADILKVRSSTDNSDISFDGLPGQGIRMFSGYQDNLILGVDNGAGVPINAVTILNTGGSVGIGTTAPTQVLDVVGTGNFSGGLNVGANAVLTAVSAVGGDASGTLGNIQLGASSVGASELASTAVTLGTYGNATYYPVVTVDADGRLTTVTTQASPSSQWEDIVGGIRYSANATINGSLTIGDGTSSLWQYGASRFGIGNTAGTEQLTILQTSGNVGVGTTNPSAALQVAGATKFGDTIPLATLTILNPDAGSTIPWKKLSIVKTYKLTRVEGYGQGSGAAGTNCIYNLRLVNDTNVHQSNLLLGSTINNSPLAVTSFLGGGTIPANQRLAIDMVSEGSTLPQAHLELFGAEQ